MYVYIDPLAEVYGKAAVKLPQTDSCAVNRMIMLYIFAVQVVL